MRFRTTHPDRRPGAGEDRPRLALPVAAVAVAVGLAAVLAACGSDDDASAGDATLSPAFDVLATEMAYNPDHLAVEAGTIDVVLHNDGVILHDLRIEGEPFIFEANAGATATGNIVLEPGRYEFFCSIPGHRAAGMEGVLEVR